MHSPLIPGIYNMGAGALGLAGLVVWGFFSLLALAVIVGLVFLLVRFLLVATRAAQLYVQKNEPAKTVAPPAPTVPPVPSAPASATTPTTTVPTITATAPTTKPHTPKNPKTPKTPPAE